MELQKFYDGDEFRAYEYLGAHPYDGGFVFRAYAPAASNMCVIGEFSDWQEVPMQRVYNGQFWEAYVEGVTGGQLYKLRVYRQDGSFIDHADPYAFLSEKRPGTASVTYAFDYDFGDDLWMWTRTDRRREPLNIYEVHAGSWVRNAAWDGESDPSDGWLTYEELADRLVPHMLNHHYNALELMPLAEHPADESWGYQETGFFSATSRYGTPRGLQYLVDKCHQNGISVILDVVTVHFAVNDYALWNFDGTPLYEYPNDAVGQSEWGSINFMHSRRDVCTFLQSSCAFWLDKYHFDGLRFDAVGNLIYWQGDASRGVNWDTIRFVQRMNAGLKALYPNVMLIAEDSTTFVGTTKPVEQGGLGFDYKWDLGWMNDTLKYLGMDEAERHAWLSLLLLSMDYFRNERYLLPLSHDEVVHGKGTIVEKMYGDFATRMARARLLYLYMFSHPGKKLNFMGNELALTREWDERRELDWESASDPAHACFQDFFGGLSNFYLEHPALWERDYDDAGFEWLCRGVDDKPLVAFYRTSSEERLLVVLNFSDDPVELPRDYVGNGRLLFDTSDMPDAGHQSAGTLMVEGLQGLVFAVATQ